MEGQLSNSEHVWLLPPSSKQASKTPPTGSCPDLCALAPACLASTCQKSAPEREWTRDHHIQWQLRRSCDCGPARASAERISLLGNLPVGSVTFFSASLVVVDDPCDGRSASSRRACLPASACSSRRHLFLSSAPSHTSINPPFNTGAGDPTRGYLAAFLQRQGQRQSICNISVGTPYYRGGFRKQPCCPGSAWKQEK